MKTPRPDLGAVRIVLVEPQVPGNVGAAARAMKNMGIDRLVLVNPWFRDHPQSRYMAHNSEDILQNAITVDTLNEAVGDCVLVAGTTRRHRHNVPYLSPQESAARLLECSASGPVAVMFGREDQGLSNDDLAWCHIILSIPSSQAQPSLNLSQAVMVVCYELYRSIHQGGGSRLNLAATAEIMEMYDHLRRSLTTLGFQQWNDGDNYMKSLRRVFSRTQLEHRDVAVVHKLCGEIDKYAHRLRDEYEKKGGS